MLTTQRWRGMQAIHIEGADHILRGLK